MAETGIAGTFLNHSEHKMADSEWRMANRKCREIGLETAVFASDVEELKKAVLEKPSFVVIEPPELIASKNTSIAKAKPDLISDAVKICKDAKVLLVVGAGIKSGEDVKTSVKLGAMGVAVSSAVVLAQDPYEVLVELAGGFK